MIHKYLGINDRNKIEGLKSEGYSSRGIAKILGFHHSTISRELKRCKGNYEAMNKLIKPLPKGAFKSFTSDRGKEFACYKEIERLGIGFYFADPYSTWQRGSNENSNGLLREYCPK